MTKQRANSLNGREWLKNSFSVWRDLGRDSDTLGHPAPFPVALASRILDCYAGDPNGVVLDPFAGSGSTLLAALQRGMKAAGFDINPDYRSTFERRLTPLDAVSGQWTYDVRDARTICDVLDAGSVEICISSPPYWDILNRRRSADQKRARPYSQNGNDLGNMPDYGDFLDALACVADQVGVALGPKRYFILNVMDIRKGPVFYPLHQDASNAVTRNGRFTLEDIIIWDRQADYNSMRPLGYPYKFIVNKVHEYLLVFRRSER